MTVNREKKREEEGIGCKDREGRMMEREKINMMEGENRKGDGGKGS